MASGNDARMYHRLPTELREQFVAMCQARGLGQQDANIRAIRWLVAQDALVQAVVLGTMPADPDVVRLAVERMGKGKRRG